MEINITKEDSDYMYSIIKKILDECGPRMPCSPQEAKAAKIIKKELEETCDEVLMEPFKCHPRAALGWIRISIFLVFISFICFFLIQLFFETVWSFVLAIIMFGVSLLAYFLAKYEFFNYREFIDPLFKEKNSQNVIGKIRTRENVKNILIFSGHIDSAYQYNLLAYLKAGGYGIVSLLGLGVLFLWIGFSAVFLFFTILTSILGLSIVYDIFFNVAIWFLIIGGIPMILLMFFTSPGERANKVPGAVDNLSAIGIIVGLGRYLKKNRNLIPENTEIRLIGFGCEEAFLRGAYRYVEAHLDELKEKNAECINFEMIQNKEKLNIWEYEPTTRTRHSRELIQKIVNAGNNVNLKIKLSNMGGDGVIGKLIGKTSGGTDAAAFSKSHIKACTVNGSDFLKVQEIWHTPRDTFDKIEEGSLETALKLCIGYLMNELERMEN
ncbi:MAG: M28 family metallopeptidase [Promethearchaeota archaeon]|jgi:hypothetical protein